MRLRSRLLSATMLLTGACVLGMVWPMASPATLSEVGVIGETTPVTKPSCPEPKCEAVSRTTGYQTKVGSEKGLLAVTRDGTIVAWTISLGKPNANQIKYLDSNEGGESEAAIAILEPQKSPTPSIPDFKLVAQSPVEKLEKYFGETAQFPLETTLKVKKGDVIGLTVPTWVPALALGFPTTTSWRASRTKAQCSSYNLQTAMSTVGDAVEFYCLYTQARLTYSATLISTP